MLPMDFGGLWTPRERFDRAMDLLERVGMADQARKLPSSTSGGQQQRVAVARALANDPPLIVADEPTGNLDSATADIVFAEFESLVDQGRTIVTVTHDASWQAHAPDRPHGRRADPRWHDRRSGAGRGGRRTIDGERGGRCVASAGERPSATSAATRSGRCWSCSRSRSACSRWAPSPAPTPCSRRGLTTAYEASKPSSATIFAGPFDQDFVDSIAEDAGDRRRAGPPDASPSASSTTTARTGRCSSPRSRTSTTSTSTSSRRSPAAGRPIATRS